MGFSGDVLAGILKSGDFLSDLLPGSGGSVTDQLQAQARGVDIRFQMLPGDRDAVIMWLGAERDRRGLRTTAETLAALAKDAIREKANGSPN
jgi:hypothetical protein